MFLNWIFQAWIHHLVHDYKFLLETDDQSLIKVWKFKFVVKKENLFIRKLLVEIFLKRSSKISEEAEAFPVAAFVARTSFRSHITSKVSCIFLDIFLSSEFI